MKTVMVRYKTFAQHAEANAQLIQAVFEELRARDPGSISYAAFRLADGVTFVHLARHAGDVSRLTSMPAFQAFQAGIKQRCEEPPVAEEVSLVGSYGFPHWGAGS